MTHSSPHADELDMGYVGRVNVLVGNREHQGRLVPNKKVGRSRAQALHFAAAHADMSVQEFCDLHSLAPWLEPFRKVRMLGMSERNSLGRKSKSLSICECCVAEDLGFWQYSYWRRSHQIIGVTWCMKHGVELTPTNEFRADLVLPHWVETNSKPLARPFQPSPVQARYASIAMGLLENRAPLDAWKVTRRMHHAIRERLSLPRSRFARQFFAVRPQSWFTDELMPPGPGSWVYKRDPDNALNNPVELCLVGAMLFTDADEALSAIFGIDLANSNMVRVKPEAVTLAADWRRQ